MPDDNNPLVPREAKKDKIIVKENQSDLEKYKNTLISLFENAKTLNEREQILNLREGIQKLQIEDTKLEYARKYYEGKLKATRNQVIFLRGQQIAASLGSISLGIYLFNISPYAGILFMLLGLAKPLGYSLDEISKLIEKLQRIANISQMIPLERSNKNET